VGALFKKNETGDFFGFWGFFMPQKKGGETPGGRVQKSDLPHSDCSGKLKKFFFGATEDFVRLAV